MTGPVGLLLLSGGKGSRLGGTKHDRPHPSGHSWGGHLVMLHRSVFGEGPVCILGTSLPDFPDLPLFTDPGEGPAVALRAWAAAEGVPDAERWWVVACDQVRWDVESLRAWQRQASEADPEGQAWVVAEAGERLQTLGGFLPRGLRASVARSKARSMHGLLEGVQTRCIHAEVPAWEDIDTVDALRGWQA
jgi:molybdopterin-guanine dinucleotide biosynthesis protein A